MKPEQLRREIAEGLLYTHARLSENTRTTLETSAFLYGLVELLNESGIVAIEDLDTKKKEVAQRLIKKNNDKGVGVLLQDSEYDKYTFKDTVLIDCESRIQICKAACCRLPFALSRQDIRENVVHWDLGQPYIIAQENDGYCKHLARSSLRCGVHDSRPVPCRAFDCRKDQKIWLDFDRRIINPQIRESDWPRCVSSDADHKRPTTP